MSGKWIKIALAVLALVGVGVFAWAQIANVTSSWSGGDLIFSDVATGNTVMQIKQEGIEIGAGTETVTMSGGDDLYVEGTSEFDGAMRIDGAATLTSTLAVTGAFSPAGDITLDDGVTHSPSLIFKDATDSTFTFQKQNDGFLTGTPTEATKGFNLLTGNLKVGNGTPGVTQDGEDGYVEGTFEVDGLSTLGALTLGDVLTFSDGGTIDNTSATVLTITETTIALAGAVTANSNLTGDGSSVLYGFTSSVTDATTAITLAAADSGKVYATGDTSSTFTLPTSASGLVYTVSITSATTHYIDCAAGDRIAGTNVDGDRLAADAIGEYIQLTGRGTSGTINWIVTGMFGTWTDSD